MLNGRAGAEAEDKGYWLKFVKTSGASSPALRKRSSAQPRWLFGRQCGHELGGSAGLRLGAGTSDWLRRVGDRRSERDGYGNVRSRSSRNSTGDPSDSRQRYPVAGRQSVPPETSSPLTHKRTSPLIARM